MALLWYLLFRQFPQIYSWIYIKETKNINLDFIYRLSVASLLTLFYYAAVTWLHDNFFD